MNMTGHATFNNATVLGTYDDLAKSFGGARMLFDEEVCITGHQSHMCLGGGDQWRAVDKKTGKNMVAPVWRYMLTNDDAPSAKALSTQVKCNCKGGC
jgi:hypothetical protein|eukprot:COSAG06_NODE_12193_length_1411_cov_1.580030_2_plen_97_part_00